MLFATVLSILLSFSACSSKESKDETISTLESTEDKLVEVEPEYEKASRPIKDFWIFRNQILALTEKNELYFGAADSSNPLLIVSNVKEVIMSEERYNGFDGLILLNDGKIIKLDNNGSVRNSLFINENLTETPDCSEATYDVSADRLFNEWLYYDAKSRVLDLEGNVLSEEPVKDGYVFSHSTDCGFRYNGLFLLQDGTVVHRFAEYNDGPKERIITTDAAKLNVYSSESLGNSHYCSVIRNNGELLTWMLDEYRNENAPLNSISKIASNANPKFDSINYGEETLFIDKDNTLCYWSDEQSEIEKLKSDVKYVYYNGVDLCTGGVPSYKQRVFVIDKNYNLYYPGDDRIIFEKVKELVGDGLFANHLDNKCCRFDGEHDELFRTNNVKKVKVKREAGCGDVLQVYLKYGGSLYAAKGGDATLFKTAFCELPLQIAVNGTNISLKQSVQSKNDSYMLPYDELGLALGINAMEDKTTNGVTLESGSTRLEFVIGNKDYQINGKKVVGKAEPFKDSNGFLWIPIEEVAKGFGYKYSIKSTENSICISIDK